MTLKNLLIILGIVSATFDQYALASQLPTPSSKIDSFVLRQMKAEQPLQSSIFIILNKQADLSAADALPSKEEKGRYVYKTLRETALATQGPLLQYLRSQHADFHPYYIQNMIAIQNPTPQLIMSLAARTDVLKLTANPLVKLKLPNETASTKRTSSSGDPEPNLSRIGATKVWENFNTHGEGIVVAGQDTGVQWDHPALIHQYRGTAKNGSVDHNYNWHDAMHQSPKGKMAKSQCAYNTPVPCDDVGHGTHTMGTIVGDDYAGNKIGVAPKAQWMACRNMYRGVGTTASYIECFEFFLAPYPLNGNAMTDGDPAKAPHIINNSWGCERSEGCKGDEIAPSLTAMKKAGILVVASAGNDGPGCGTIDAPPAWHTGLSITVGAFDHRTDRIASFSSRGPSAFDGGQGPNIAAPGVSIRSSVPGNRYESMMWSGTSMAGPHVVGAAALLWSLDPQLVGDVDKTIELLEKSAEPKTTSESCGGTPGTHIPNNTFGSGLLNVSRAACLVKGDCAE